jgi:hypothetical protein
MMWPENGFVVRSLQAQPAVALISINDREPFLNREANDLTGGMARL